MEHPPGASAPTVLGAFVLDLHMHGRYKLTVLAKLAFMV